MVVFYQCDTASSSVRSSTRSYATHDLDKDKNINVKINDPRTGLTVWLEEEREKEKTVCLSTG